MKKLLILGIIMVFSTIFLCSCEMQCVCYNYTNGSSSTMYNAYSKRDCDDWNTAYQPGTQYNPKGYLIECNYEKK